MADLLTPDEIETLRRFLARALDAAKYPFSDESRELRAILAKISPHDSWKPEQGLKYLDSCLRGNDGKRLR